MRRSIPAVGAAALALLLAAPGPGLAAQETREFSAFAFGRPRLGVTVELQADAERDKLGARISEVTAGGPAAKAGLQAGDIITKFNGTALGGLSADADRSGPGAKLVELAQALSPGDTARLEYRRGSETRRATVVAENLAGVWSFRTPAMREMEPRLDGLAGELRLLARDRAGGLELAELNPDLGDYFGAKSGVLVLRQPADSSLPLKAGDVILSIDGRQPQSVGHARRILGSYEAGEAVKLEIMRKQRRSTVTWTVPAHAEYRWQGPHFERLERPRVRIEKS